MGWMAARRFAKERCVEQVSNLLRIRITVGSGKLIQSDAVPLFWPEVC